jgi:hypothetical protein
MTLGVDVRARTARVPRGIPTETGTWFVAGPTDAATDGAQLLTSIGDFETAIAARDAANQALYDAVDAFFGEGGQKCYVAGIPAAGTLAGALAQFDPQLGPGQVSVIGQPAVADTYTALHAHARVNNRVAIDDVEIDSTVAEITAIGGIVRALADVEYGGVFGPWVNIPAPSGIIGGGARQVPASPIIAALCARADALGNPNRAAAGRDFPLQYVTSFVSDFSSADREAMLDAGVNTFATVYGVLENYGFQTAVEQSEETPYWQLNCSRARMWIKARADARGENYVFKNIDGRGRVLGSLRSDIEEELLELYGVDGLYGETPADAFAVNVTASVNTDQTIAQGEMHAVAEARLSMHAKAVIIDLVTVPVTGQV